MHTPTTMIIPRFQRKRSYDELAWSRAARIKTVADSDSDDSGATVLSYRQHQREPGSPPQKLRCNCEHMGTNPELDSAEFPPSGCEVFLGGSCGANMWRRDTAIPILEESGVSFYNPQLEEGAWHSGLIAVEAEAKEKAAVLLFVVDGATRGLASMIEVATTIMSGRAVVVVVDHVPEGAVIAGDSVSDNERKDLNRARDYLVNVVEQRMKQGHENIEMCSSIAAATRRCVAMAKDLRDSADQSGSCSCAGSCHGKQMHQPVVATEIS